jgi:hypothetical protein
LCHDGFSVSFFSKALPNYYRLALKWCRIFSGVVTALLIANRERGIPSAGVLSEPVNDILEAQ